MTSKNAVRSCLGFLVLVAVALALPNAWAVDDSPPPIVHVLATDPCAAEAGGDTATFTVLRTGPTNAALTVRYRLAGTASNGVDYAGLFGEVTIPACASSAPITVAPIDDALVEGTETLAVFLHQPIVWPPPYVVCWPSLAFGHIEDNDAAPTNRPPLVRLTNPPDGSVFIAPVDIRLVAQASDPDGRVRSVEFFDGTNSLGVVSNRPPIVQPVPIADDVLELAVEKDPLLYPDLELEANVDVAVIRPTPFTLLWREVPPGAHTLVAVATDHQGASTRSEAVHIRVSNLPPQPIVNVRASDAVASEPNPAADRLNTATFTIHRSGSTDFPMTVFYRLAGTASNGVDYAELPHSVTIPHGSSTAEVVIEPLDDRLVEGSESVVLRLAPPVCIAIFPPPPDCYRVGPYDTARAVIHDNDLPPNQPPVVEMVRPLDGSIFLAPADIALVAAARDFDGRVVTVEFFAGTNSLGIVTNNPGLLTSSTPAFSLKWSDVPAGRYLLTAEATDNDGAIALSKPVEIHVVERSLPPVVSIAATDPEAAEGSLDNTTLNTAIFTVTRTGPTERSLLVLYSLSGTAANGIDYRSLPGHVTIPSGAASAPIVVEPIDDRLVEGPETVGVTLEASPCIALDPAFAVSPRPADCYLVGTNDQARAVIRDNDLAPTNTPPQVAIIHPNEGDVFVAPADIRLCAEAKDAEGFVRTVEFFAGGTSLGIVSNRLNSAGVIGIDPILVDPIFCLAWREVGAGGYLLTAKATDNRGLSSISDPVHIKVIEGHLLPVVTIHAVDPFASEGDILLEPIPIDPVAVAGVDPDAEAGVEFIGPPIFSRPNVAVFAVKRDRGTNQALTVRYSLDGTAANERDYRKLDGSVTIPAGAWQVSIIVDPIDDKLIEGTETVIASLEPIGCARIVPPPPECYLVGDPARAVAYIRDNDFENRPPKVAIAKPLSEETFLAPADIEIVAVVSDPDGYVTEVEFFEGTNSIGKETRVYIVAPPPGEIHRFSMIWSNVPPGRYQLTANATDNEGASTRADPVPIRVVPLCLLPVVSIEATDRRATEQDPRLDILSDTAAFQVTRSCRTENDLKVRYEIGGTASNGEDYHKLDGVVLIPAGSHSAEIVVDPIDDDRREDIESVEIKLLDVVCVAVDPAPADCYIVGQPARDVVYIHDNDHENFPPRVAIVRPETGEHFKEGTLIPIVVQTVDPDGWVGRVEFFDGNRSIGVQEIHFLLPPPPGQLQRFSMIWSNAALGRHVLTAKATDDQGVSSVSGPVLIEVVDVPPPPVVSIFAVDPVAREGAPTNHAVFRVRRTGETDSPLTVHYAVRGTASNGVDYVLLPGNVTIPAGRRTARVVVAPIDDRRPEPVETVFLRLHEAALYNTGRWNCAGAVIVDNDRVSIDTLCLADRNFHLRLDGLNGGCYRIELSNDLRVWEATEANHVLEGAIHFVDPEASEQNHRFYRIRPAMEVEVFEDED